MRLRLATPGFLLATAFAQAQDPLPGTAPNEHLLLLDMDADLAGSGRHPGALFTIDLATQRVVATFSHPAWSDPNDLLVEPDGSILVLDFTSTEPDEKPLPGALFEIDADGRSCRRLLLPPGLVDPYSMARAPDGSLWILDKSANPRGAAGSTGTVWRLSPDRRTLSILATGPPLVSPAAVLFDDRGALLLDADAGANRSGTLFRLDGTPPRLTALADLEDLVSPLGMIALDDDALLIVDTNRNRTRPEPWRGALQRFDRGSKALAPLSSDGALIDPIRALRLGAELLVVDASADPLQLGVDTRSAARFRELVKRGLLPAEARARNMDELVAALARTGPDVHLPVGFGGFGGGCIHRIDPRTGRAATFLADPRFVNPVALARRGSAPR